MKTQIEDLTDSSNLRKRAENRIKKRKLSADKQSSASQQSDANTRKLLHELQVHQIELEMQNFELLRTKEEAELANEKYSNLYNFAPNGYITLSKGGNILELNYTAARMLGKEKSNLINTNFGYFITEDTRAQFQSFIQAVFTNKIKETCTVTLAANGYQPIYVLIEGILSQNEKECFTSLVDITQQKQAELLLIKNEELVIAKQKAEISEQITREFLYKLTEAKEKVENSESRIKALLRAIPDMMFILNNEGIFIEYHTHRVENLFVSPEMFLRKNISEIFESGISNAFRLVLEKAIESKELQVFEYDLPTNSKKTHFESRLIALENDKILCIVRDITERKKAEQALTESNQLLSSFVKNSPIFAYIKDVTPTEGRVIMASDNFIEMIGIEGSKMVGKTMHELFPADLADKFTVDDWNVISSGKIFKVDEDLNGRNYSSIKFPITIGNKNLLAGYSIDITETMQAEIALRESEHKFKTLADYTYNWEFWISPNNTFNYISPSCQRITGYTPNEFKDDPNLIKHIIHIEDLHKYQKHLVHVNKLMSPGEIDFRIVTKHGQVRWINHICQPVFTESGNFDGFRGSNRDITNRKAAEKEILELNEKLQKLNFDKDRFISILAHDLKNPFNTILGLMDLLIMNIHKYEIAKIKDFLQRIDKTAHNTYNLLDDLLMWVRAHSGKLPFEPQNHNLSKICNDVLEILKINAHNKTITITQSISYEINIFADINMVKTILRNLFSNAIKFTEKGGKIEISADQIHTSINITVKDSGIGIKPETLVKLFDNSQKNSTVGTENETGTGLGLLLCKEFVEKHGGKIWVESQVGKGSSFKFTLPASMKGETFYESER